MTAQLPPPPPVRRSQPELPAPRSVHTVSNELALSRTVLASAAPVDVPVELQAAVLVPAPRESRPEQPSRPALEPPASRGAEPLPAVAPYQAVPVEETPAIATAAFDVQGATARPRPGFRARTAVGVATIAVVTGLGLTLLVGRALDGHRAEAVPPRSATTAPPQKRAAARPPVELPAKAREVAPAAAQRVPAARAPAATPKHADVPVSSVTVPSCKEMLGGFVERADPKAALAETQLANRELVRGNVDASHASFCRAALWDGKKIERWLNLAQMFLIRRDAEKTVETAERALELDPKNARALEILGDARARLGDLRGARRAYLDAERRPEPDEDTQKWLVRRDLDEAQRSMKSRDFVRAERLFRRVVVFDSEHVGAALGIAACLRKLDDQRGADAWERRAETLARAVRSGSKK